MLNECKRNKKNLELFKSKLQEHIQLLNSDNFTMNLRRTSATTNWQLHPNPIEHLLLKKSILFNIQKNLLKYNKQNHLELLKYF